MIEDLQCYKNDPLRLSQVKTVTEVVNASRGAKTSLLDRSLLEKEVSQELLKLEQVHKFSFDDRTDNVSNDDVKLSSYVLEGKIREQLISYQLKYGLNYIGRDSSNDLAIKDSHISRLHAILLVHTDNSANIFDLKSLNGVCVNDRRVTQALLSVNDSNTLANCYDFVFKSLK